MKCSSTSVLPVFVVLLASIGTPAAAQDPWEWKEAFALGEDRASALDQLAAGSDEDFFYRCLHLQNSRELTSVGPMLRRWMKTHGRTSRFIEIENRQALLSFAEDPTGTYEFLRERLDPDLDHRRDVPGHVPDLPTQLDPDVIARETLLRAALEHDPHGLNGLTDAALPLLVTAELTDEQLGELLKRLPRPDHAQLPALVVRDLTRRRGSFGSRPIHGRLLLAQLEECARLSPTLLSESAFVDAWVRRLAPAAGIDIQHDDAAREELLERLESFARRLPTAVNSLLAHVLYHRLAHDRAQGVHDKTRFLDYLRLPRKAGYRAASSYETRGKRLLVDSSRGFPTGLLPIGDDESLVRAYLEHFLASEQTTDIYRPFIRESFLRRVFAETKILTGAEDEERWIAMLNDPAAYEALRRRVEIGFAPTQRRWFGVDDPVTIDLDLKNTPTLLVKVFELDTFNVLSERLEEIDASLNLDGLVPNQETTHTYQSAPQRRVRRHFEFPSLTGPGVTVVDFIGNGLSSRAVIHKGALRFTERLGSAGHVLTLRDAAGRALPEAAAWLAGQQYEADAAGEVVIPYSTDAGTRPIILRHDGFASLGHFEHREEIYTLHAGVQLDREALRAGGTARLLIRPELRVNGQPADLVLLEDPVLSIVATDHEGVVSSQQVRGPELSEEHETVHEIQVPERLAQLTVQLRGHVRKLSRDTDVDLFTPVRIFTVNAIEPTTGMAGTLLGHTQNGYVLDVLGRTGEAIPARTVKLRLAHRLVVEPIAVTLQTDERGRIQLGALPDVTQIRVEGAANGFDTWTPRPEARNWPERLHTVAGRPLRVPYVGAAKALSRSVASLLELRNGAFARDRFEHLALIRGHLVLRDLPLGEYDLWLVEAGRHISIHVSADERPEQPLSPAIPLQVLGAVMDGQTLTVQLSGAGPDTRVHVLTTRYLPPFHPFDQLTLPPLSTDFPAPIPHAESIFASGREISGEYRYILERRYAQTFPGNMLPRPSLLLNRFGLDETRSAIGVGGGAGGSYGRRGKLGKKGKRSGESHDELRWSGRAPELYANLDFLPGQTATLANLVPDEHGRLTVPLADLGKGQLVHVLAVDGHDTVYTSLTRPETALVPEDLRLANAIDGTRHVTQQRRIEPLGTGATAVIEDATSSQVELLDSLSAVFRLFSSLGNGPELQTFAFLLRWPELDEEERLDLYARHACHELHLFLHEKDPAFFEQVVRPYLAHKLHKTFLDHWLLDDDLARYTHPWEFGQLNVVERILLARRTPDAAVSVPRHLAEVLELLPRDPDAERRRFEALLAGNALDTGASLGETLRRAAEEMAPPRSLPTAAAPMDAEAITPEVAQRLQELGYLSTDEDLDDSVSLGGLSGRGRSARKSDAHRRDEVRSLWQGPNPTRRWVEHHYWHRRIEELSSDLVPINAFWLDFAQANADVPFVSPHVAQAAGHVNEMLLALAVLDLPFSAAEHETSVEGQRLTVRTAGPALLVARELAPAIETDGALPVLVSQDLFRLDDRYRYEGAERRDHFVSDEFLTRVVYGCQVVLTNPTSALRHLELLLQIPAGSVPVSGSRKTRGLDLALGPFSTTTAEMYFYFPRTGFFDLYPAHVSQQGELLAAAETRQLTVLAEPSHADPTSWEHVSQNAPLKEVLTFLDSSNLFRLDLSRMAWRMTERASFDAVTAALTRRHVFSPVLWAYGLEHGDAETTRQLLEHQHGFVQRCGLMLDSPLLTIDAVQRHSYQHVEFDPLVNARAHRMAGEPGMANARLEEQYTAFLEVMAYRPVLDDTDWISATYYLLLQDRIADALDAFAHVAPDGLTARLQVDYAAAYLGLYTGQLEQSRAIATRHREHPVERWRTRFGAVLAHLDEAEGNAPSDDSENGEVDLVQSEPTLELELTDGRITLRHEHLRRVELNIYAMDIELLFSTNPFGQQDSGSSPYIKPNHRQDLELDASGTTVLELPAAFRAANVLLEVRARGLVRRLPSYSTALVLQMLEPRGQLKLTDAETGRPLPAAYVKVYARLHDGQTRFHKDGYTDLRGRFAYASLSAPVEPAARYAVLVLSAEHGATIREVAPPLN